MKKFWKVFFGFISFVLGWVAVILVTPYARAHRADPNLIGGEILLPILFVLLYVFISGLISEAKAGNLWTKKKNLNWIDEEE